MKFKARVSEKDFLFFILFCLILFFIIAIGFLNISVFISSNEFHGFNPLPAFSREYFPYTLLLFVVFLIIIFASISSHIFEFEKGVGLSLGEKDEKGYTRWAREKELKKELKMVQPKTYESPHAGIAIINDGREMWIDDGEHHSIIIGATGSGKTQAVVHPLVKSLAKKGESMILTDPKGEIYEENAEMLRERGYKIVLLNFRQPQRGNSWNPLQLPFSLYREGNQDKSNELLDDLAMNILYDEKTAGQDPFWERTSADYFAGLALGLFEDAKPEEINLNSIGYMTTVGEEKSLGTTYIKEYFSHKDPASSAYVNAASTLLAPHETKSSILAVFKQKIRLFSARENLSEMLAYSDFDIKDIGREKTAVFLLIHDEKTTYHALLTIFIKQCYESLIDVAQESGGQLRYRTNFILDEFANMPPLKDVTTMVTAARSRNIRFNFIIQNFSQLNQLYGKENAETIKGNCGNLIYLISSELSALEEISKLCGEVKQSEKEKTDSRPLVTVSDLQRLKKWEAIILRSRFMPFKTKLTPNFKIDWGYEANKAEYIMRERNTVNIFDLKKFVEEKRKNIFNEANRKIPQSPMMGKSENKVPPKGVDLDALIQRMDQKIAELEKEEAEKHKKGVMKESLAKKYGEEEKPPFIKKAEEEKKEAKAEIFQDDNAYYSMDEENKIENKEERALNEQEAFEQNKTDQEKPSHIKPISDIFEEDDFDELTLEKEKKETTDDKKDFEKNEENIKTEKPGFITDDQFFDDFFGDD